jgi:hypothetical protein
MTATNESSSNEIRVDKLLNASFAVTTEDGQKLFELINESFNQEKDVIIDFSNIDLIVSTFLNASIGQLYGMYSTEFIQQHLSVINMGAIELATLKLVTDRAKEYFKDKKGFERVFKKNFPNASE